MPASLAGKALVPVGLAVTGFMVVCCLVLYSVIREDLQRAEVMHATSLAETILKSTRYAMLKSDRETLGTIIANVGQQKVVDHARIFSKKGIIDISANRAEIGHQVDKRAEGCIVCHKGEIPVTTLGPMQQARTFTKPDGTEVMAITAPIYNEPECFTAACHFHAPHEKLLGTLDIGLTRHELNRSLAQLRLEMTVFTVMCLLLTVGGVTALLKRSVFIPVRRLVAYVEQTPAGDLPPPPPHLPADLDRIATNYYTIRHSMAEKGSGSDQTEKRDGSHA